MITAVHGLTDLIAIVEAEYAEAMSAIFWESQNLSNENILNWE